MKLGGDIANWLYDWYVSMLHWLANWGCQCHIKVILILYTSQLFCAKSTNCVQLTAEKTLQNAISVWPRI